MSAVEVIRRVLSAKFLSPSLTYIPEKGASSGDIELVESQINRCLSDQHRKLLESWNGINLDVLRVYGATPTRDELKGILSVQEILDHESGQRLTAFCESPAGLIYFEDADSGILMLDLDGGDIEKVAFSIDDFFERFVFGKDAAQFAGEDWYKKT